jgi:hypothetical protein
VAGEALLEVAREGDAGDAAIFLLLGEHLVGLGAAAVDLVRRARRPRVHQVQIHAGVDLVDHVAEVDALAHLVDGGLGVAERAVAHLAAVAVGDERRVATVALCRCRVGPHPRLAAGGNEVEHRIDTVRLLADVAIDLDRDGVGERRVVARREPGAEGVAVRTGRRVHHLERAAAVERRAGHVDLVDVAEERVAEIAAARVLLEVRQREAHARLLVALRTAGRRRQRDAVGVGDGEGDRHRACRIGRDRGTDDLALQTVAGDLGRHRHRRRRCRRRTRRRALRVTVATPDPDRAADPEHGEEGPQVPGPPLVLRAASLHCGQCPRSRCLRQFFTYRVTLRSA